MDSLDTIYVKASDCVTREIAGETIIVPIRNNVGDLDSIYTLNEVGTRLWQLVDGTHSVDDAITIIYDEYEVSRNVAARHVAEMIMSLLDLGLIHRAEGTADKNQGSGLSDGGRS
jgi:hypothetical protein